MQAHHGDAERADRWTGRILARLTDVARQYPLTLFFALTYLWSWPWAWYIVVFRAPIEWIVPASFGPTLAAVLVHRLGTGSYSAFAWWTGWQRVAAGSAAAIGLTLLTFVALPGLLLSDDPRRLNWAILASPSVYNYSTFLGGPLGEEPGWRGYALPQLEQRMGPIRAWLMLGTLWTTWHVPLFFAPEWHAPRFGIYLALVLSLCLIMNLSANLARFALIPAILGHAAFNSVSRYLAGLFANAEMTSANGFWRAVGTAAKALGMQGLSLSADTVIACGGVVAALTILGLTRGRLGYRAEGNGASEFVKAK